MFYRVVVVAFKEFIHKFLEVYFDGWTVFGLVNRHVSSLNLMLDTCLKHQKSLNLQKCIFCIPYVMLFGHVVCKKGLMVDPAKIIVIINFETPNNVGHLHTTLGHTRYYRKFIKAYAQITAPTGRLLKKDAMFFWDDDFQKCLDVLKEKMVTVPLIVLPNWNKEFRVHLDASCIALGAMLTQPGTSVIGHPIAFVRRKLSQGEKNYSTTEHEGLVMVYALQKFIHYSLGVHFKMHINHSSLKDLVNKPALGGEGGICRLLLLFQEYGFEVVVKLGRLNARPNHLSRIGNVDEPTNLDEGLPDAQLFTMCVVDEHFADIIQFLSMGIAFEGYTME